MSKYAWSREWLHTQADAQKVGEEYEKLEKQLGGVVTPADLLAWAEDHPRSETYKLFDWDDASAARKQRMQTASNIILDIRQYKVQGGKVRPVRRNYNLRSRGGYVNRTVVETEIDAAEEMITRAHQSLGTWLERFAIVEEEAAAEFRMVRKAYKDMGKLVKALDKE